MSLDIQLLNPYFQWERQTFKEIIYFFKGNILYINEYLTSENFIYLVSSLNLSYEKFQFDELNTFLRNLNGEYALIIESPYEVICAVDRIRSIPLFYSLIMST